MDSLDKSFAYIFLCLLVMLGVALGMLTWASTPASGERLFESLVRVEMTKDGKAVGHGSGFILTPTKIVTAKHVGEEASKGVELTVTGADGSKHRVVHVELWKDRDFAIIEVEGPMTEAPAEVSCKAVESLDTVYIVGYPMDLKAVIFKNLVVTYEDDKDDIELLIVEGVALPGNSGGPVFNEAGEVVGILVGEALYMMTVTESWADTDLNIVVPLNGIKGVCV